MANQWCSNQIKAISRGREAVGGTPTAAGGTPALPDAWGLPLRASQGRLRSTSQIGPPKAKLSLIKAKHFCAMANQWCSNQIKAIRRGRESCRRDADSGRRDADSGRRDARAPRRMGSPAEGQSGSIKVNKPDRTS